VAYPAPRWKSREDRGESLKRPRILHIITRLGVGGSARHVIDVSRRLRDEFEVVVASGPEEVSEGSLREEALGSGIPIVPVPSLKIQASILKDRRALRELDALIRDFAPSVVHTHQSKAGILGRMAARRAGVKRCVHTFHSPLERLGRDGILRRANTTAERRLASTTDRLLAVSESLREELVREEIVPADRVEVILPLVEPARYFVDRAPGALRGRLRIAPHAPLVGLVGRLAAPKDPEMFLRVFSVVAASLPDARAVVIGDGPLRPAMESLASKLGLQGKVAFTGWVSDVQEIYADLDLLMLTSRYEGFALSAFEAMAASRAVIAMKVTGAVDLVDHGRTGLLVSPGDSSSMAGGTILLLRDAEYRSRLGGAGREAAARMFSGLDAAHRLAALYQRLVRPPARLSHETGARRAHAQ
jgi:glycosyltransferase involved in cell wall biosynthesis